MNTELLQAFITRYSQVMDTDPVILEQRTEHERRKERAARLLTREHIPNLTREEWIEFLRDTEAALGNPWAGTTFWQNYFPEGQALPEEVKNSLLRLIEAAEQGLGPDEFNKAIAVLPNIGPGYLSEMLALRFPDRYWMLNRLVRTFLEGLGIDLKGELPRGKKTNEGEEYMIAGRYLREIRQMLSARMPDTREGHMADFMETDLFMYWALQDDVWKGKIERIVREEFSPQRQNTRTQNEAEARKLIERKLGNFTTQDIHELFRYLNTDFHGKELYTRFMPALYGSLANKIGENPDAFNRWLSRLWAASDEELDAVLEEFWDKLEVSGAGISMPTALLYLRDPKRYTIWIPNMQEGLRLATNFTPGRFRTASGYRTYNDAALKFRRRYSLSPQALDFVLWRIGKDTVIDVVNGKNGGTDPGSAEPPVEKHEAYTFAQLQADTFLSENFWSNAKALMADKRQIILYGPPGTGKTWVAKKFARYWMDLASDPQGEIRVVQFHPSYSYEEFVEGIRPQSVKRPGGGMDISYEVRPGIFRLLCEEAYRNPARHYVLILDEINRGEIARIFGELLYLLEYRDDAVVLPYSGSKFSVPKNLYIIGTMNSADRSIALVDHALRRRFHFVEMRPSVDVLRAFHEQHNPGMVWAAALLDETNRLLKRDGIEWHLHIGHSHLMSRDLDDVRIRMVWDYSVLPTLQEYFYRRDDILHEYGLDNLKSTVGVNQ